ncbi:MAG: phosphate/phosphite/phosphonate ABC transporter substrate-binding protein [Thermodesulfobacteriota bacterium]
MNKRLISTLVLAGFFCLCAGRAPAADGYVFGVLPFKKPAELNEMFQPFVNYLSQALGAPVVFRSAKDYASANEALLGGQWDFAYLGPSLFAEINAQAPGKVRLAGALVTGGQPTFRGVVVAAEGSPIQSVADFKGKKFAFGDRDSTLSCYVPAHMLMRAGVFDTLSEYKFLGSHDNVAMAVTRGDFDGGGLQPSVAAKYVGKGLKVVAESDPVYEHVVVIGPKVDEATAEKVRNAVLGIQDPSICKAINKSATAFAAVKPSDYDSLKKLMDEVDARIPK